MIRENLIENMVGKFVVVTTDHTRRGVFAGVLAACGADGNVVLRDAQQAVYWSVETRGVFGLAAIGPQRGSRIGPPVPQLSLNGVTSVSLATDEARALWEAQPWS